MHDQFYWPCMGTQAKEHIRKCYLCLAFKAKLPRAPLENILATHPLEPQLPVSGTWEESRGKCFGSNRPLSLRYAQAYVTRAHTAQTTAKTLWDKFIVHYGLPKKILLDQGWNFESHLVVDLCELMGTWTIWTSLYHPQTNGQCKRFNSTLINMLGMLSPEKKSEWKNHIGMLVYAYNCTWNSATEFSPYYLMYGRQPYLPVDVALGLTPQNTRAPNMSKFMQKIREHTKWTCKKGWSLPD